MKIQYSENFIAGIQSLSMEAKKALRQKLGIMLQNPRHPSLRTKKIQGRNGILEASITMSIRITWEYTEDGIFLRNIGEHDKTLKSP